MNRQVEDYIEKQSSPQREICRELRKLILRTLPGTGETMKWGVPAFDGGNFYIVALKDHVNLGFSLKGLTGADTALFDGGGKTMKHIQIEGTDLDEDRIVGLLRLVHEKAAR
jgi:hypothetical protein